MTDLERQLAEGERALEEAANLLAKAAGTEDDLDEDFEDFDEAANEGDEAAEEQAADDAEAPDEEGAPDEDAAAAAQAMAAGAEDGDEPDLEEEPEEEDDAPPGPVMAKAADMEVRDATPILEGIQDSLTVLAKAVDAIAERVGSQDKRLAAQLDALKAQQASVETLAKAQGAIAATPLRPKSQGGARTVTVPTTQEAETRSLKELFVKADGFITDPVRFGKLEHYVNRNDLNGFLDALTPDERARVLAA